MAIKKVSVIVPMHNGERFISRCIESILIIPELSEPPVRTLGATIPENESRLFR